MSLGFQFSQADRGFMLNFVIYYDILLLFCKGCGLVLILELSFETLFFLKYSSFKR